MGHLEVTCENCGATLPSGIVLEGNVQNVFMSGNRTQCPRCGFMRAIPDGVYSSIDGIMSYIASTTDPLATSRELQEDLERLKRGEAPKSEHMTKVEKFLRNNKQTVNVALAVLGAAITIYTMTNKAPTRVEIHNTINQIINQTTVQLEDSN